MTFKCFQAFWGAFRRFQAFSSDFRYFQAIWSAFIWGALNRLDCFRLIITLPLAQNTCVGSILCLTSIFTLTLSKSASFQALRAIWLLLTSLEISRHFMCYYWGLCLILALLGAFCLFWCYRVGFVPTRSMFAEVILTVCVFSSSNQFLSRKNLCRPISSAD